MSYIKKMILAVGSLALSSGALQTSFASEHHHEHGHEQTLADSHQQMAHEHGVAHMTLTIVNQDLLVEVNTPLYNVLGFEHKPNNDEQKAATKKQIQNIQAGNLIEINPAAKCELKEQSVKNPFHHGEAEHEHKSDEHNQHSGHKDLSFEYHFYCQEPKKMTDVSTQNLFTTWTNLQNLRVEWIYNNRQSASTLTADNPSIRFE